MLMDKWTIKGQTNRRIYTNFERNLAIKVTHLPTKFEFDWTEHFRVRVWKRKMLTDKQTNKRTELHEFFERNLAMMVIYLPTKFGFDWTKRF